MIFRETQRALLRMVGPGLLFLIFAARLCGQEPVKTVPGDSLFFTDFPSMEPKDAVAAVRTYGKWYYRTGAAFMARDDNVLHVEGGAELPDLSHAPNLLGRYNLYLGLRGVSAPTGLQIKTSGMDRYATVSLPAHPEDRHVNYDILWAKDVAMDNQRVLIHACGWKVYLDYLKFVPSEKDRDARVDERFVTYGPRRTSEDETQRLVKQGVLTERTYRDPKALPPLTDEAKRRGYVLFPVHWMDLIFPSTKPSSDPGTPQLHGFAAQGEVEPVAFAIHALQDIRSLGVALAGPLRGEAGEFSTANIDIREVRCLRKRTTHYEGKSEFMDMPCYLEPTAPRDLPTGETRAYWITVDVPRETPPGTYGGDLVVSAGGEQAQSVPFTLTVYPFALAPLDGMNIGLYYRPTVGLSEPLAAFRDMKRHGMTSVGWFGASGLTISGPPEAPRVSLENSDLAGILDSFVECGLSGDILWAYSGDAIQVFCNKLLPDEEAFDRTYAAIIRQLVQECETRKWPRILFQQYDEAPSNKGCFPALIRELRATKRGGGITEHDHMWIKTPRPGIQQHIDQCVPFVDIFTLRYSGKPVFYVDTWRQITDTTQQMGRRLYTYNINNGMALSETETMRFSAGWFFRTVGAGCSGYYLWAYQYPCNDIYNDLDGHTDYVQQYPAAGSRKGGPALYWEALREGVDDLKYVVTLEKLVEKHRTNLQAAGPVKEAERLLKNLAGSFDVARLERECVFLECRWDKTETLPDGRRIAESRFHLPTGWTFEKYDEARRAVAESIIHIQNARSNSR